MTVLGPWTAKGSVFYGPPDRASHWETLIGNSSVEKEIVSNEAVLLKGNEFAANRQIDVVPTSMDQ